MARIAVTPLELELVYHVAAEMADGAWRSVQSMGVGAQTRRADGVHAYGFVSDEARQAIRALCEVLVDRGVFERREKPGGAVQYRKRGEPCLGVPAAAVK